MTDLVFHPPCSAIEIRTLRRPASGTPDQPDEQVAREGYIVYFSAGTRELPSAYTAGLTDMGLPELILYGRSPGHVRHAWSLIERVLDQMGSPGLRVLQGQFDGQTVSVRRESLGRLQAAYRLYGPSGFKALQVYWTVGSDNHLPQQWEIRFLAAQPFLGDGTLGDLARSRKS